MIHWKSIDEFIEPNWEKLGTSGAPALFWRGAKGALLGYVRDGELFEAGAIFTAVGLILQYIPVTTTP